LHDVKLCGLISQDVRVENSDHRLAKIHYDGNGPTWSSAVATTWFSRTGWSVRRNTAQWIRAC